MAQLRMIAFICTCKANSASCIVIIQESFDFQPIPFLLHIIIYARYTLLPHCLHGNLTLSGELKRGLNKIASCSDEGTRMISSLSHCKTLGYNYAQFANNECNFGMGLDWTCFSQSDWYLLPACLYISTISYKRTICLNLISQL